MDVYHQPGHRFLRTFFLSNVLLYLVIGYRYLSVTLASKTFFVTTLYGYHGLAGHGLVLGFAYVSFIGQLALFAFLPWVLLNLIYFFYPNMRWLKCIAIFMYSLVALVLLADRAVFSLFHFHMNATLLSIAFAQHISVIHFLELSQQEIFSLIAIALGMLVIESLMAWLCIKYTLSMKYFVVSVVSLGSMLIGSYTILLLSLATGNNVFAQQTPNFPLYNTLLSFILPFPHADAMLERFSETQFSQPLFPRAPLHYPLHTLQFKRNAQPLNVVVIGIDAWRFDGLNAEMSPHLYRYAKQSLHFTHHFSGGNSTQAGLFSLFYGIPSNYWASMLQQRKGALLIKAMQAQHYETRVFYSSDISTPPMNKTLFVDIPGIKAAPFEGKTSVERDKAVTHAFENFLATRDTSRPLFSFLFYDSAHSYCQNADIPQVFPVRNNVCSRMVMSKDDVLDSYHHYQNGVHFVDEQIANVLASLKKNHLANNTIVIITGDHGEEFNDSGQDFFGHGSNYTRYQVQTPLLIYWPGKKAAQINYPTHHYDIVPTLMRAVLHCNNPYTDYSVGKNLFDGSRRAFVIVGSYINMAIVQPQQSITLLTSGNVRLANNEAEELIGIKPDPLIMADALRMMRKFYYS